MAEKPRKSRAGKQVGTLLTPAVYRKIKGLAAMRGCRTGELIDIAIREYLAKQPEFTK